MPADDTSHDDNAGSPPAEYLSAAHACEAMGISLPLSAWRDAEILDDIMRLFRRLPDKHLWQDAHRDLVRALLAIWPGLASPVADSRPPHRRRHDYARDGGPGLWPPLQDDDIETRQFLADALRPDEEAVYFVEPTGPGNGDTTGFWMGRPKGAYSPSRAVLREMTPAGRRALFKDLGWRRI